MWRRRGPFSIPRRANEHYRQTTGEHYARAASKPTGPMPKALQGALQTEPESARTMKQSKKPSARVTMAAQKNSPEFPGYSASSEVVLDAKKNSQAPRQGLEPWTRGLTVQHQQLNDIRIPCECRRKLLLAEPIRLVRRRFVSRFGNSFGNNVMAGYAAHRCSRGNRGDGRLGSSDVDFVSD
jgi:hypothetical protein